MSFTACTFNTGYHEHFNFPVCKKLDIIANTFMKTKWKIIPALSPIVKKSEHMCFKIVSYFNSSDTLLAAGGSWQHHSEWCMSLYLFVSFVLLSRRLLGDWYFIALSETSHALFATPPNTPSTKLMFFVILYMYNYSFSILFWFWFAFGYVSVEVCM